MSTFAYASLHVVHVLSIIGVVGALCYRAASASKTRLASVSLIVPGILALVTGVLMTQAVYASMPPWVWAKALSFFGILGCALLAYRFPSKASLWLSLAFTLAAVALVAVYLRPF